MITARCGGSEERYTLHGAPRGGDVAPVERARRACNQGGGGGGLILQYLCCACHTRGDARVRIATTYITDLLRMLPCHL